MGKFIVFEGLDGSGKSTHIKLLYDYLISRGENVKITAEPTDYESGKQLRTALSGASAKSACEMAVMFVYDRIAHNINPDNGIEAMLDSGAYVICDRYYYSSLAYQGSATDFEWVRSMNLNCPEIRRPDVCIYLDIPPQECIKRINKSRNSTEIYEKLDILTLVEKKFKYTFKLLSQTDNIKIVDANRDIEEVSKDIREIIDNL